MFAVRRSQERGAANHGWLDSKHTFSFADYYDPRFMGFRVLRVINEDLIAGGAGFPTHPHKDMEIVTYVIEGALAHKDTLGNATTIRPGEVQHMSAGTGIQHSEFNPLPNTTCHLLQIWILPEAAGFSPRYGQISFEEKFASGVATTLALVASRDGRDGSVPMHQDVDIHVGKPRQGDTVVFPFRNGRYGWLQVVKGSVLAGGHSLEPGDALAVGDEASLSIAAHSDAEFLLFDLP